VDEVPVKKQVAANARQVVVLADSSKINRDGLVMFLPLEEVHTFITDAGIAPAHRAALEERGIQVLVAEVPHGSTARKGGIK
jgi:DeoR/GlpR family transcriptional regulator of sugar metabolism